MSEPTRPFKIVNTDDRWCKFTSVPYEFARLSATMMNKHEFIVSSNTYSSKSDIYKYNLHTDEWILLETFHLMDTIVYMYIMIEIKVLASLRQKPKNIFPINSVLLHVSLLWFMLIIRYI